jgi:hypothetical protein
LLLDDDDEDAEEEDTLGGPARRFFRAASAMSPHSSFSSVLNVDIHPVRPSPSRCFLIDTAAEEGEEDDDNVCVVDNVDNDRG